MSWNHVNFYGEYNFRETPDGIDLAKIVDWLEAFYGDPNRVLFDITQLFTITEHIGKSRDIVIP